MTKNQEDTSSVLISSTGSQHGFGSDPWKWVSGLTREEQKAVKEGRVVLITGSRPSGGGAGNGHGTTLRVVRYVRGRYVARVPASELVEAFSHLE